MIVRGILTVQSQRNSWYFLHKQHALGDQFSCYSSGMLQSVRQLFFWSVSQAINQVVLLIFVPWFQQ